jgi:predicted transcriptional regulator
MARIRDRMEIISQILEAANTGGGATRIRIMYKTFLGYNQLKEYLNLLTEKDLVRYDKDTQTFKTTEKGRRFLQLYNEIGNIIEEQISRP